MAHGRQDTLVRAWTDATGRPRVVSPATRRAVLAALGDDPAGTRIDPIRLARPGDALPERALLVAEDGTDLGAVDRLPRDLPFGYHRLSVGGRERLLIVPPARCWLPRDFRAWGWAVQLYAARSSASWGIGDLADLAQLAAWCSGVDAGVLLVSPMGAPNPGPNPQPCPYIPSSRRYRDPLLIRIEEVPGAQAAAAVAELATEARTLNEDGHIDRTRALVVKLRALEAIWRAGGGRPRPASTALGAFRTRRGEDLTLWATYVALTEELGAIWRSWPEQYRHPRSPAVARFAAGRAERVAFHTWVQWLIDEQLRRAAEVGPRIITDLPVGFDPNGFDAWCWQDLLASSASIGAPPDVFNAAGQDWAVPPFIPARLRKARMEPFVRTVRDGLRHAGGIRVDHVLGLFRLWWVPHGLGPADGAYVRYPVDELLAVLAIESARAGALVIGEDLGTVERGVRNTLRRWGLLSTRLAYFERRPPATYPRHAMAGVTTHDLPTVAGVWTEADLADQRAAGLNPDPRQLALLRRRLARVGKVAPEATTDEAILAVHAAIARSPAALAVATLEDASRVAERPNLPGTTDAQRPNWSTALPTPLEKLTEDAFVLELATVLRR
jgi:4-alpha-glucanotransferase